MSRGKGMFVVTLCMFLLMGSLIWLHPIEINYVQNNEYASRLISLSDYAQHAPIEIMNDTALASYAVSGTGDAASPYILEGWNITALEEDSILIYGTTKHFVVRDCWLSGSLTGSYRGVRIISVASGTAVIENVHCESWYVGIDVSSSPKTVVKDCRIQNCEYGLWMSSSSDSTIFNNTVVENEAWGMDVSSSATTVANNTLWGNAHGLKAFYAYNITLENNTMYDDGVYIVFDNIADYETVGEKNNLVNGLPLAFLINEVGTNYGGGIGQAILINCTSVKLTGQNLSYCESGAFLRWCSDCQVTDSHLDYNDDSGIYVDYSDSINVEHVSMTGNSLYGLQLTHCTIDVLDCDFVENKKGIELVGTWGAASVQMNRFVNNTEYGLLLNHGWNVSVTDNTFTEDGISGLSYSLEDSIKYAENVTSNLVNGKPLMFYFSLQDVTISSPHGQVFLANCSNVVLTSLDCSHTVIGIGITLSNGCSIINSDCSYTKQSGVSIISSNFTLVQNVNCDVSVGAGIKVVDAEDTTLIDNQCSNCYSGIDFLYSRRGLIKDNTLTHNSAFGIRLYDSEDARIYSNVCEFSFSSGIFAETSFGLHIVNNTCNSNNAGGIDLWDCFELLIHSNDCGRNRWSGISLMTSGLCIIAFNRLVENEGHGLHIMGGYDFEVSWNTMSANGGDGIRASSWHSRLMHNILALNNGYGLYISSCENESVHHNLFVSNNDGGVQGYDSTASACIWYDFMTAEGNYWSDWDGAGPYCLDGTAGAWDLYPLGETDSDSDTLLDSWEIANGLNPYSLDSDMDSLPDAWEVLYGLNPLADDTAGDLDDDGLSNLEEYLLGLNPESEDSDADLMPDLWEVQNYLNPLFNDAAFDPDGDDISNLYEYYGGTNPHVYDGTTITTTVTTTVTGETPDYTLLVSIAGVGGFSLAIVIVIVFQMISRRRSSV
ncbi:MAG: NosD domain-containing protein [Candidatus Thorarchaeota archaeon]